MIVSTSSSRASEELEVGFDQDIQALTCQNRMLPCSGMGFLGGSKMAVEEIKEYFPTVLLNLWRDRVRTTGWYRTAFKLKQPFLTTYSTLVRSEFTCLQHPFFHYLKP